MIDQFAEALVKMIRRDLNTLADTLANGNAQTFEDYRFTCGMIKGLGRAEEYIKELAQKAEEA